jgi:hypothetical protein
MSRGSQGQTSTHTGNCCQSKCCKLQDEGMLKDVSLKNATGVFRVLRRTVQECPNFPLAQIREEEDKKFQKDACVERNTEREEQSDKQRQSLPVCPFEKSPNWTKRRDMYQGPDLT